MDIIEINKILEQHELWLESDGRKGTHANLSGVDLSGANLEGVNFEGANLYSVNLKRTNLKEANLSWANLLWANLEGANLSGANLSDVDLSGANLSFAALIRADLTLSNLHGANLDGAKLRETTGNMKHVKSIFCEILPVTYTAEIMHIGCERHSIEDWWSFDDRRIIEMGGKEALEWWRKWKPILQQIIAASPATATGYGS